MALLIQVWLRLSIKTITALLQRFAHIFLNYYDWKEAKN